LGYITHGTSRENLAYKIQKTMQELQRIAKTWDVLIVLVAHVSKADQTKPPKIHEIKDSSGIPQEADTVIMLWRENKDNSDGTKEWTDNVILSVQANRIGPNGDIKLKYKEETGDYLEHEWVPEYEKDAQQKNRAEKEFLSYGYAD